MDYVYKEKVKSKDKVFKSGEEKAVNKKIQENEELCLIKIKDILDEIVQKVAWMENKEYYSIELIRWIFEKYNIKCWHPCPFVKCEEDYIWCEICGKKTTKTSYDLF